MMCVRVSVTSMTAAASRPSMAIMQRFKSIVRAALWLIFLCTLWATDPTQAHGAGSMQAACASNVQCLPCTTSRASAAEGVHVVIEPVLQQPVDGLGADVDSSVTCWWSSSNPSDIPQAWVRVGGHCVEGQRARASAGQSTPPARAPPTPDRAVNADACRLRHNIDM